jgi:hypothetical protein
MPCNRVVLAVLVGWMLAGCHVPEHVRTQSWWQRFRSASGLGADMVQMDVALIERPIGETFIEKEIWDYADEQIVELEHKAAVDDNGFRVGQIVGIPPMRFQSLVTSERSCVHAREWLVASGKTVSHVLGPVHAKDRFHVKINARLKAYPLEKIRYVFEVTPKLTGDGRTRLRFTPKVEFGETMPTWKPAADGSGWSYELAPRSKVFPELSWEVVLVPNAFLVIGAATDQPDSLGYHAFVDKSQPPGVQRLFVIRTNRSAGTSDNRTLDDRPTPPLAAQALTVAP